MDKSSTDLLAEFPVVLTVAVQWGDQDAMQHVNNVVYFRWCESARIAYFGRIGLADRRAEGTSARSWHRSSATFAGS